MSVDLYIIQFFMLKKTDILISIVIHVEKYGVIVDHRSRIGRILGLNDGVLSF
jgi:hypothetical protein